MASDQVLDTVHIRATVLTLQQQHLQRQRTDHDDILSVSVSDVTCSFQAVSDDWPSHWLCLEPPPSLWWGRGTPAPPPASSCSCSDLLETYSTWKKQDILSVKQRNQQTGELKGECHLSLSCRLLCLTVTSSSALCLFSSLAASLLMAVMWASSTVSSFTLNRLSVGSYMYCELHHTHTLLSQIEYEMTAVATIFQTW